MIIYLFFIFPASNAAQIFFQLLIATIVGTTTHALFAPTKYAQKWNGLAQKLKPAKYAVTK
jgi:hypothetical protein